MIVKDDVQIPIPRSLERWEVRLSLAVVIGQLGRLHRPTEDRCLYLSAANIYCHGLRISTAIHALYRVLTRLDQGPPPLHCSEVMSGRGMLNLEVATWTCSGMTGIEAEASSSSANYFIC